ncbi:hypothetical protein SLS62_008383 [Diatrype stigma]|uniref:Uncharacterized protein n=1 Tax=Diatrype stigma TaxID=117547 RepID=A0AAN9UJT9_9PEZI
MEDAVMAGPWDYPVQMGDPAPNPWSMGANQTPNGGNDSLPSENSESEPEFTPPPTPEDPTRTGAGAGPGSIIPEFLEPAQRPKLAGMFKNFAPGVPVPAFDGQPYTPDQKRVAADIANFIRNLNSTGACGFPPAPPPPLEHGLGFGGYPEYHVPAEYLYRPHADDYYTPPGPALHPGFGGIGMGSFEGYGGSYMHTGYYSPHDDDYYADHAGLISSLNEWDRVEHEIGQRLLEALYGKRQELAQFDAALGPLQHEVDSLTAEFQQMHFHGDERGVPAPVPVPVPEHVSRQLSAVRAEAAGIREQRARARDEHQIMRVELAGLVGRLSRL